MELYGRRPLHPQDARRLREGRGQGEGPNYLSWVLTQDYASPGFDSRIPGTLIEREYHTRSEGEANYLYVLERGVPVRDIREHYPLLPLDETVAIAEALGVPHAQDPDTGLYRVMTTDFLVTVLEGVTLRMRARAVTPSHTLGQPGVQARLEIERRYWAHRQVDWGIVTAHDVPPVIVANAKYLRAYAAERSLIVGTSDGGTQPLSRSVIQRITTVLTPEILRGGVPLNVLTAQCDDRLGQAPGVSLMVARHLLGQRLWPVDFTRPIVAWDPVPLVASRLPPGEGGVQ